MNLTGVVSLATIPVAIYEWSDVAMEGWCG